MIRISITAAAFQRGRGCEPSPLCASWQGVGRSICYSSSTPRNRIADRGHVGTPLRAAVSARLSSHAPRITPPGRVRLGLRG